MQTRAKVSATRILQKKEAPWPPSATGTIRPLKPSLP